MKTQLNQMLNLIDEENVVVLCDDLIKNKDFYDDEIRNYNLDDDYEIYSNYSSIGIPVWLIKDFDKEELIKEFYVRLIDKNIIDTKDLLMYFVLEGHSIGIYDDKYWEEFESIDLIAVSKTERLVLRDLFYDVVKCAYKRK